MGAIREAVGPFYNCSPTRTVVADWFRSPYRWSMALPATRTPTFLDRAIEALVWVDRTSWSGLAAAGMSVVRAALSTGTGREPFVSRGLDDATGPTSFAQSSTVVRAGWAAALEFPYVAACVRAISQDLATLPLRARDGSGKTARRVDNAPALDLLANPNSRETESQLRQAVVTHYLLSGAGYLEPVPLVGSPVSVVWHHPDHVLPQYDSVGRVVEYYVQTDQGGKTLGPKDLIRISFPAVDPTGEPFSPVRSLLRELGLDWQLRDRAYKSAQKGGPDALLHPEGSDAAMDMLAGPELEEMRRDLRTQMARHRGEPMLVPRRLGVTPLGFTQLELASIEQRDRVRDAVLAAFGVPPVRIGLPTANYAQSREMMDAYWGSILPGYAEAVDDGFTQLSARFRGQPRDRRIFHDLAGSVSSRIARTDALGRVKLHHDLGGMDIAAAYAYEGLDDAPVSEPAIPAEPPPTKASPEVVKWLDLAFPPTPPAPLVTRAEDDVLAKAWRAWIRDVHGPTEARMRRAVLAELQAQRDDVLARLAEHAATYEALLPTGGPTKGIAEDLLDLLLPPEDAGRMGAALRALVRSALQLGWTTTAGDLDHDMAFSPTRIDPEVDGQIADLVRTHAATRQLLQQEVREALLKGESISMLQSRIQEAAAFSPARALRIARSEATRSVNAGHMQAFGQAVSEGVDAELEWITARDNEVRTTHIALDGKRVEVGDVFTTTDGDAAAYPGAFEKAANNVNCRCGVRARRRKVAA